MPDPRIHVLVAAVLLVAGSRAQSWQQVSPPTSPPARAAAAMATDLAAGRVLMFGGYTGSSYLGDTRAFDGAGWNTIPGAGPSARSNHGLAFDEQRGALVLFGGVNGIGFAGTLSDTWELTATGWSLRPTPVRPPARFGHAIAYDRTRGRVVVFGGRTNAGIVFLDDTWEWDGVAWTLRTPAVSPSRRMNHTMAFDPVSGRVLLFGGIQLGGPVMGDTWSWDGVAWTQHVPATPPAARMQAGMAVDEVRGRVVMYGGVNGTSLADTAEWDGSEWHTMTPASTPGVPVLPAMAGGPAGRHVVLFGGQASTGGPLAGTWSYGHLPLVQPFGTGCGTTPLGLSVAGGSEPRLGQDFVTAMAPVSAGALPFMGIGFSSQWAGSTPLPLDLGSLGMTGCWLYHDLAMSGLPCVVVGSAALHTLPVPAAPFLAGFVIQMQGYVFDAAAHPAGVVTSSALAVTLGY